ncbi:DUF4326 domain-containing protein [Actinobaculum sp. 352]|uniref:DUF4326 domain-containing protein n=1 Tax=Actinobaculum sp. 352 TaxID=2490946 RepID=UPI000F7F50DA|nr:DUF4326 domain-containing protein [Actinobaculum sp. 352]RTE47908.1 DUF4326 domain-containing protein [Actinobaculum sp. 352]
MTYTPKRVQRRREKGWKMPLCGCGCGKPARYVGRPTRWGNPAIIGQHMPYQSHARGDKARPTIRDAAQAVEWYTGWLNGVVRLDYDPTLYRVPPSIGRIRAELGGHDLACYCPPDQPCHADVLLALANPEDGQQ